MTPVLSDVVGVHSQGPLQVRLLVVTQLARVLPMFMYIKYAEIIAEVLTIVLLCPGARIAWPLPILMEIDRVLLCIYI